MAGANPRPYKRRLDLAEPLVTGKRVIDTFFPIPKGALPLSPAASVQEKPSSSSRWRVGGCGRGSDVGCGDAATKWPKC